MKPVFLERCDPLPQSPLAREPERAPQRLRIALAGYGVVGQALAQRLTEHERLHIAAILVRDAQRPRAVAPPAPLTTDRRTFLAVPADILVEVTSCETTGALLSEHALARGVHVVSASKRVVSACRSALTQAGAASGGRLLYSAAVGGGAPVLETVAAARERGEVRSFAGILNGTVNYILDRLARGDGFASALADARRAGFAEEDPTQDLSGADASAKLRLVAAAAWGCDPAEVDVDAESLDDAAIERIEASEERWIQLAEVDGREGKIAARVRLVPRRLVDSLPYVPDEWNCAAVTLVDGTVFRCRGRGAGGAPTAEALHSDLTALLDPVAERLQHSLPC